MSIDAVYRLGEDALQNLFEINFGPIPIPKIGEMTGAMVARAANFNIPSSGWSEYQVHYKTHTIDRVGGKAEAERTFAFDMRVDRYWTVYKAIVAWKNAIFGTYDNEIGPDFLNVANPTNYRIPITVKPCGADGKILSSRQLGGLTTAWVFDGCIPKTVGDVGFDYSAGDPVSVNITFSFLGMKDFLA